MPSVLAQLEAMRGKEVKMVSRKHGIEISSARIGVDAAAELSRFPLPGKTNGAMSFLRRRPRGLLPALVAGGLLDSYFGHFIIRNLIIGGI